MSGSNEDLSQLINESPEANFGTPADAPSDEWIERAEGRLRIVLPPSYKWWLRNYGGGEIGGEEIFSVYCIDFDEPVGGDIVFANEHRTLPPNRLAISDTGADEEFYFDTTNQSADGEFPVMLFEHPDQETLYAENFTAFLRKRIEFFQGTNRNPRRGGPSKIS